MMDTTTPLAKLLDAAVLASAFVFNALVLDADWQSIAIAVGGSVSGSVILAYFRRDPRKVEQLFKVVASAIGGLVLGTVSQEYLRIESQAYRLGLFFIDSMLALVVLRALLSVTEQNAVEIIRGSLQKFLNLRKPAERRYKYRRRIKKDGE